MRISREIDAALLGLTKKPITVQSVFGTENKVQKKCLELDKDMHEIFAQREVEVTYRGLKVRSSITS